MQAYMPDKAMREIEEKFKLEHEALHILDLVVMEWRTDPQSVQCFDLRIVEQAKLVIARLKELDPLFR